MLVKAGVAPGMLARRTSCVVPDVSLEHEDADDEEEEDGGGAALLSASCTIGGYSSQMWM